MSSNPFSRFAFAKREPHATADTQAPAPAPPQTPRVKRERSPSPAERAKRPRPVDAVASPVDARLELLRALLEERGHMTTPIDEFGTQVCAWPAAAGVAQRFQLLAAALLSAQTSDQVTFAAMQRLHAHSNALDTEKEEGGEQQVKQQQDKQQQGLTVESVLLTAEGELAALLRPVGFYRRKAQQLKRAAALLRSRHAGDVPQSLDELQALPGVGPKVARVVLLLAWGRVDGVIVDTHVQRLAGRFGWASAKASTPEDTRRELEAWLPREHWSGLSLAVVGFGQTVCTALRPKCGSCPLAHLCPSAFC